MATEGGRTLSPAPQRPSHRIQCCAFSGTQIVANAESPSSATACNLTEQVIDTALALAEEKGSWSAVRLHDVAERLSVQTPQRAVCSSQLSRAMIAFVTNRIR
jgi:hypothetical protein